MATSQGLWTVRFLGKTIYCDEPQHAAALQHVSDILNEVTACNLTAEQFRELTRVLMHYACYGAVRTLGERAHMSGELPA